MFLGLYIAGLYICIKSTEFGLHSIGKHRAMSIPQKSRHNMAAKAWYARNRGKVLNARKSPQALAQQRAYYLMHRDRFIARTKAFKRSHPEKCSLYACRHRSKYLSRERLKANCYYITGTSKLTDENLRTVALLRLYALLRRGRITLEQSRILSSEFIKGHWNSLENLFT